MDWTSDRLEDQVVEGLKEYMVPHHDDESFGNPVESGLNYMHYI